MRWRRRWLIGLATAVAMVVLVAVLRLAPARVIQVAMLDAAGASRGSDAKELAALRQTWTKAVVASFERGFINAETVNCDDLVRAS